MEEEKESPRHRKEGLTALPFEFIPSRRHFAALDTYLEELKRFFIPLNIVLT